MDGIQLNFIDQSNDANNSSVVIFQRNEATSFDEQAVAWQVIQSGGRGYKHPFKWPLACIVAARDNWGNCTPGVPAEPGQVFRMVSTSSGDQLQAAGPASNAQEIQIVNGLPTGSIDAEVYKDGRLLATRTGVSPQQKAVFQFKPTIWIGVVSQLAPGQVINSAIISSVNTELNLLGIASADIVMTGGGRGPNAQPFAFTLQNVVTA